MSKPFYLRRTQAWVSKKIFTHRPLGYGTTINGQPYRGPVDFRMNLNAPNILYKPQTDGVVVIQRITERRFLGHWFPRYTHRLVAVFGAPELRVRDKVVQPELES